MAREDWRGELLQQVDDLRRERAGTPAPHQQRADRPILVQQRHGQQRPEAGAAQDVENGMRLRLGEIGDLHRLAPLRTLAHQRVAEVNRMLAHSGQVLLGHVVAGLEHELVLGLVEHVDGAAGGLGHLAGVAEDGAQHRLQVERGVDGLAHLAQRLELGDRAGKLRRAGSQFVQEPNVLDGDDGLIGEALDQLDLLLGEAAELPGGRCR